MAMIAFALPVELTVGSPQPERLGVCDRQLGMYGPPPSCKRKVKIAVWSAQMYPVFD
jgi:hypothetical protein